MISISIDVTKIDKDRLYKGQKGTYLDAVLIDTPNNQYGDNFMIVQSVSKEEREQGIKGEILGNGKILGQQPQQSAPQQPSEPQDNFDPQDDDLPF